MEEKARDGVKKTPRGEVGKCVNQLDPSREQWVPLF